MIDIQLLSVWFMGLLPFALALVVLMVLDAVTGALYGWKHGFFYWEWLPNFLKTGVLFFWAWLTAELLAIMPLALGVEIQGYGEALVDWGPKAVLALVAGKYIASIVEHFKRIEKLKPEELEEPEPELAPVE
mgnify:CR=1 FL=1